MWSAPAVLFTLLVALALVPPAPVGASGAGGRGQAGTEAVCPSMDVPLAQLAERLGPLGETARTALAGLTASPAKAEVLCGIRGLAALGDVRAIPPLAGALKQPAYGDDAYMLARWAAWLAGGSDASLAVSMLPIVEALGDDPGAHPAGDDGIYMLGEIDRPESRDRLLAALDTPAPDARIDAVVHALARQGDARARERIAALGDAAARAKSGNATPEQARRLGAVAFYQLALGPEALAAGLATLGTIALRDQEWAASWAVHTLCAAAARRPTERAAIHAHRLALVEELDRRGVAWLPVRGRIGCS